jgi:hypothetical protein
VCTPKNSVAGPGDPVGSPSGQQATFEGTIGMKGQTGECTFKVTVEDCGEPGRNDTFSIDILPSTGTCSGQSRNGTLEDRGNIQIH